MTFVNRGKTFDRDDNTPILAVLHDISTGRILCTYGAPRWDVPSRYLGHEVDWIEVSGTVNGAFFHVADGAIVPRPVLTFDKTEIRADGIDQAVLPGLPRPCTVRIDGEDVIVEDGELVLTAEMPAVWRILVADPFPARSFEATVTAVAVKKGETR